MSVKQNLQIYYLWLHVQRYERLSEKLIFWLLLVVGPHSNLEFMKTSVIIALVIVWFQPFTLITNILITGL